MTMTAEQRVAQLNAELNEIYEAIQECLDAWEGGDLADAVNNLAGFLPDEWEPSE